MGVRWKDTRLIGNISNVPMPFQFNHHYILHCTGDLVLRSLLVDNFFNIFIKVGNNAQ